MTSVLDNASGFSIRCLELGIWIFVRECRRWETIYCNVSKSKGEYVSQSRYQRDKNPSLDHRKLLVVFCLMRESHKLIKRRMALCWFAWARCHLDCISMRILYEGIAACVAGTIDCKGEQLGLRSEHIIASF